MAYFPVKPNGGSGGKKGHSNMVHYTKTEEIKESANNARRKIARKQIDEFFDDFYRGMTPEQVEQERESAKYL
jgi:hypothetical protein